MKDACKILYNRLKVVLVLTFFVAGAIVFKMTKVMFFERNYWNEVSSTFLKDSIIVEPRRGDILSDQDLLMASSSPQYAIYIDFGSGRKDSTGKYVPNIKDQNNKDNLFSEYLDEVCIGLADIVHGTSVEYWKKYLKNGHDRGYRHYALTRASAPLSYNQYIELKKLKWFSPQYRNWFYSVESNTARTYPYGTLAGRVVGKIHIADDNKPRFGLELSFDSILRGKKGLAHQVQLQNRTREEIDVPAIDGSNVHTTLNVEMQDIAEQALRAQMTKVKEAVWGTAVVMEVATGDIKAMASLDVVNKETHALAEIRNNAVVGKYEPGSTFKTASILVGMEHGNIKMTDQVNTGKGIHHFYHNDLKDHNYKGLNNPKSGYGVIDVPHILMYSSNIGVACLIDEHYHNNPQKYVQAICDLGYDHHWDMQLLGVDKPKIDKPGDEGVYWYEDYLAWMSIGYNVSFPIINTLVFYNSIANNGKLVAPRLVRYVTDNDGAVTEKYPVQVVKEQICSRQTLVQVQEMLERVVSEGLAKAAGSPYFKVAGKTGTAQHSKGKAGYKDGGVEYLLSFCGYFPADAPKYSCVVAIYSDGGVASGGGICGPVFHEISEKIMAMIRTSDISQGVDTEHPFAPVVAKGNVEKAQFVLKSLGMNYRDDIELVPAPETEMGVVPDVVGMGASDAVYLLESMGLKVAVKGVGNVVRQTPKPGTAAKNGDKIELGLDIIH
ncbi:MAG: PASTA domain-containing protein [Bacteroidaceae bacterium]|nr:PASTA domain-containing protein [Bacteroidaceae bacterium]